MDAALAEYTKTTGTDLSETPFATAIQQSNSPEAILQLLHERVRTFKEYREGNRKLINCLTPLVKVIQTFSRMLGEEVTLVSHKYDLVTLLNHTSSGPLPTSEGFVCWDRCSSRCTSFEYSIYPFPL